MASNIGMLLEVATLPVWLSIIFVVVAIGIGVVCGYFVDKKVLMKKLGKAQSTAAKIIEDAYAEAKTAKKESILQTQEEIHILKQEAENEIKARRVDAQKLEDRLSQREEYLTKKEEQLEKKQEVIENEKQQNESRKQELEGLKQKQVEAIENVNKELEKVAGMSRNEAKKVLIKTYEDEAKKDAAKLVRNIEEQAKNEADKKAKNILTLAIQKCSVDQTSETTVSSVAIPNDEMKGRIIGREGRNIRSFEQATGVDLIIDDTPETIILSCFDPVRREIARIALEKLMLDGRIHPTRIEEMVEKVKRDIEQEIKETGENTAFDADVQGLHPEIIKVLGRLKYRTSYGQNVLKHSLEVCHLAGLMASEVGADVKVAKRGGLLHDIGKALDQETEGTHISIGVDLAKKYGETEPVIHCIEAHHGGVEFHSLEAILVQTADAISSSRPGARRESLENYIKRLTDLENIANGFKGVEKCYAIQAGREIRVMVKPEEISDDEALFLAKDIAKKIEESLQYPGQIKVNVIRESRAVDYAK